MSKGQESGYNLTQLNILIIDDSKHIRTLVKSVLHALGCRNILEAADGADGFKQLSHFAADLIITDWVMDPLDGIEFTRLVRTGKDSPNPFVPIIMLTGYAEISRVMEARDAGVNEYLTKPISAGSLYARIKAVIEKPRPYVQTDVYFGPTRRRRHKGKAYKHPDRRAVEKEKEIAEDTGDASVGRREMDLESLCPG